MVKRSKKAVVQLGVRMREPLRAQLTKAAKAKGISLNAEIVDRLERSTTNMGLVEEILSLLFGPTTAKILAGAHVYGGILQLTPGDKERLKTAGSAWMNEVIDSIPTKPEAKPTIPRDQFVDKGGDK